MLITRKRLLRRTVLRGLGAAIGLPALDAMTPAFAKNSESKAAVRLAFTYVPNGIIMRHWTPTVAGAAFQYPRILAPLEPFRDSLLVLSGLNASQGNDMGDGGGDHARASATFLTGVHPKK